MKKYRPNVGMMIINAEKNIFVGKRIDHPSNFWQMPQGGIDENENTLDAAFREMEEETGIKKKFVNLVAESEDWYYYDIPKELSSTLWNGQYVGQKQKWFLFKITKKNVLININTKNPEFSDYKWVDRDFLVLNIVPFKRSLYKKLLVVFKSYL